jgi:hypothetical protein
MYESVGDAMIGENKSRNVLNHRCVSENIVDGIKYEFVTNDDTFNNPLKEEISKLGLLGKRAWEKSIPDIYKFSSKEQRLELIRGLLDTDGHVINKGCVYLTTTSNQLAVDIRDIVYSLGGKAVVSEKKRKSKSRLLDGRQITSRRPVFEVSVSLSFNPFFCERKAERFISRYKGRHRTKIKSVTSVGEFPCKCIRIDDPRALYITDNYIVTHNSLEEKMEVWRHVLDSKCEELIEPVDLPKVLGSGKLEALPINYIRGASWKDMYVCLDEGQNLDYDAFKLVLSRLGENTKLIICADSDQSDIKDSGFKKIYDMFDDNESKNMGIVSFSFTEDDIVRSEICKFIVGKFKNVSK